MAIDRDTAFTVIQLLLETFSAEIGKVRSEHAANEEVIAAVEYEINEMRKLIAENLLSLPNRSSRTASPLDLPPSDEATDDGLAKKRVGRVA